MGRSKTFIDLQPDVPKERLTRRDVARRQLDTATDLLTTGGDWVAVHVLTMAAFEVIERDAKAKGVVTMLQSDIASRPPEQGATYFDTIRRAYTFMKHGGEEVFEHYAPSLVPILLLAAASTYWEVYKWPTDRWPNLCAWFHDELPGTLPRPSIFTGGPMDYLTGWRSFLNDQP